MFFRIKKNPTSKILKLLESYRDCEGVPRHKTIISLGTPKTEDKSSLKRIAYLIEKHFYENEQNDLIYELELTETEREYATLVIRKIESRHNWKPISSIKETIPPVETEEVKINEISHETTSELGPVLVANKAWNDLEFDKILKDVGMSSNRILSSKISIINRLVEPVAENSLIDWYHSTAMADIISSPLTGAGRDRFYRASDDLVKHKDKIEASLRKMTAAIHNVNRTILLYDLTNSHFEGVCLKNKMAKRGKNKQKRNDCPQIVVGMIFDQSGFELGHKMFAGNQSDSKSLPEMIESMKAIGADSNNSSSLVIMDSGMSSKDNLAILRKHKIKYLVNSRRQSRDKYEKEFLETDKFVKIKNRENKPSVMVRCLEETHFEINEDGSNGEEYHERVVLCSSEQRGKKEEAIISNAEKRFLKDLKKFQKRVNTQKSKVSQKIIDNKIGKLQQKHPRIQRYYTFTSNSDTREFSWKRDDELYASKNQLTGCYVLRTNDLNISNGNIWSAYISLTTAEKGFNILKGNLGLRPNFHQLSDRVDAHVFITILSYILLRHITIQLEQEDDFRSWNTIKRVLKTHAYTTIMVPNGNGYIHRIRKAGNPDPVQKQIYSILNVNWRKLPKSKITTKIK